MSVIKYREPSASLLKMGAPNFSEDKRPSLGNEKIGEFYYIDVDKLIPFHNQPRKSFSDESIATLAETIRTHGIRQPLTIIQASNMNGYYEVVSGERRLRAAKIAGLLKVPCQILKDEKEAEELALIENVQRDDLNPLELGCAYKKLIDQGVFSSVADVAKYIGVQRTQVVEHIGFSELPDSVQEKIIEGQLFSRDTMREIKKCKNENDMLALIANELPNKDTASYKVKNTSVLRIYIKDGQMRVQKAKTGLLDHAQSEELRKIIETILVEI